MIGEVVAAVAVVAAAAVVVSAAVDVVAASVGHLTDGPKVIMHTNNSKNFLTDCALHV